MAHRPGHRGSSTQARRVEQTRREQSIADAKRAAQSMQQAGISSKSGKVWIFLIYSSGNA